MGGAIALAALGSVLNNRLAHWIPRLTPKHAGLHLAKLRGSPEAIRELAPRGRRRRDRRVRALALDGVLVPGPGRRSSGSCSRLLLPERPLRGDEAEQIEMLDDTGLAAIAVTDGHPVV